jgi:hypothetical protein
MIKRWEEENKSWFDKNNIDKNAHYFIKLHPLEYINSPWGIIGTFTSNTTREKWVECEIIDQTPPYGKVVLQSVENGYGKRAIYYSDFLSGLKDGYIIKKENGTHVEEIIWAEPFCCGLNIIQRAYIVVQ